jgi:hypothetical protein
VHRLAQDALEGDQVPGYQRIGPGAGDAPGHGHARLGGGARFLHRKFLGEVAGEQGDHRRLRDDGEYENARGQFVPEAHQSPPNTSSLSSPRASIG